MASKHVRLYYIDYHIAAPGILGAAKTCFLLLVAYFLFHSQEWPRTGRDKEELRAESL